MSSTTDSRTYEHLLSSVCGEQWKRIGVSRRAGVVAPLFSLYSKKSVGIGELTDLKLLVDWCVKTGMSIIQLLPMNDVGFDFWPYAAQSTFALEPVYLSLEHLAGVDAAGFKKEIAKARKAFPPGGERVNYGVKKAKMEILWKMFKKCRDKFPAAFDEFVEEQSFWIHDYVLYKAIKEEQGLRSWEDWQAPLKNREAGALEEARERNREKIVFYQWLQWQIAEQFKAAKDYAASRKVFIMGDLPFLVSRDSADVWSYQSYFKLHLSSGAPPDLYFANGQRWGMPPYSWEAMAANGYDYLVEKLRYAEKFFDLYRIDHVVGIFRLWTIPLTEPAENAGLNGAFDPADKSLWEDHGRRIIAQMASNTDMLPCAEDLGVVPDCSYKVLAEFGIPGMDVQRWIRDWEKTCDFKPPSVYRKNSIAVISTHDMLPVRQWWEHEAGTVDELRFKQVCGTSGIPFEQVKDRLFDAGRAVGGRLPWKKEIDGEKKFLAALGEWQGQAEPLMGFFRESADEKQRFWKYLETAEPFDGAWSAGLIRNIFRKISSAASIFSIQLVQDWLSLDKRFPGGQRNFRVNMPGSMGQENWSVLMPWPLEEMLELKINAEIKAINQAGGRI